jgi:hypothetical protein
MAYDAATGNVVLFGGITGSTPLGDTWTWSGITRTWTPHIQLPPSPPPDNAPIAYDAARGVVVLFSGVNGSTWVWNGNNWQQRFPASSPSTRGLASMTYDGNLRKVVLFGGSGYNETWTWDGTTWSQVTPATAPPDRYAFGMDFDLLAQGVVMFGGFSACCDIQGDTWKLSIAP